MLARTDRCVMRRRQGRDAVRAMDGYRAVAGRGRRSDVVHGLSVGLTACGQRARLSHVPDAEAGVLRCLTALGCPRADLVDERGCVVESRVSDRLAPLQTGSDVKGALTEMRLWASGLRRRVIRQRTGAPAGGRWPAVGGMSKSRPRPEEIHGLPLAPRMASAAGWSTTVVSAVTASAAAGAAASRSLPGRPGGRRPERDVMRALVVAESSERV